MHPRFTAAEYAEVAAAAERVGLTATGYAGEAALAAAGSVTTGGEPDTSAITRAELAQLQRDLFAARTAVNQAAAAVRGALAGSACAEAVASCARSVAALDTVVARIHHRLQHLPEVVAAQRTHLRRLHRLGPAATYDAVLTGFLICGHRWDQDAHCPDDARLTWSHRAGVLIPPGTEHTTFSTSRLSLLSTRKP